MLWPQYGYTSISSGKLEFVLAAHGGQIGHLARNFVRVFTRTILRRHETIRDLDYGKRNAERSRFWAHSAQCVVSQELYAAGEKKLGTDESVFNKILCSRSCEHIQAVVAEYSKISQHSLEQTIDSEMSGDLRDGMKAVRKSS